MDVWALWSLGINANTVPYNFEFWSDYTLSCQKLAQRVDITMWDRPRLVGTSERKPTRTGKIAYLIPAITEVNEHRISTGSVQDANRQSIGTP